MKELLQSLLRLGWYWLANLFFGGCKAALVGGGFLIRVILMIGVAFVLCWIFLC